MFKEAEETRKELKAKEIQKEQHEKQLQIKAEKAVKDEQAGAGSEGGGAPVLRRRGRREGQRRREQGRQGLAQGRKGRQGRRQVWKRSQEEIQRKKRRRKVEEHEAMARGLLWRGGSHLKP